MLVSGDSYNDAFGHPAGDEVLHRLVQVLRANSRDNDFIARYGGEEFAILHHHTTQEVALVMGERFRRSIQQATWPHRPITESIGVATLTPNMTSSEELLAHTDQALYQAKQNGRNRVFCAESSKS